MKKLILHILFLFAINTGFTQIADECKLTIGINLNGVSDFSAELPFVDLMKSSRSWYTKSVGDPDYLFDSGFADELEYRTDGYPTHLPQEIDGSIYDQSVATVWGLIEAWPNGTYTILWDGDGVISLDFASIDVVLVDANRMTFVIDDPEYPIQELIIETSNIDDPVHNIRVLLPGTEDTYESQIFNELWLEKLEPFKTVRFMDWGSTNNWGQEYAFPIANSTLMDWDNRSEMEFFNWTHFKGVPYEIMIKLMNEQDKDGWVCIPHNASEEYIRNMAQLFRDNLEPGRHLYVEYSNEIWNWIFGQAQWLNEHGCVVPGVMWPEGTTSYIENALTYWTDEYSAELDKVTRVVAVQTGWLDVAERTVYNINADLIDAVAPTHYFSLGEGGDDILDALGGSATAADVADIARADISTSMSYIRGIKTIADSLNVPLTSYEGGQHLTPTPFGEIPSYEDALLDIQRDPELYNIYNEWYDSLRTLQVGEEPLLLMHFNFVASRSAEYGSWGILETLDQDTALIPAPKYQSVIENMNTGCFGTDGIEEFSSNSSADILIYPNPTQESFRVLFADEKIYNLTITDLNGRIIKYTPNLINGDPVFVSGFKSGIYILTFENDAEVIVKKIVKE